MYLPALPPLPFLYTLRENIPPYAYFRTADGQFRSVPLPSHTMEQPFPTYFATTFMTAFTSDLQPFNPHFSRWKSINLATLLALCLSIHLFIHRSNDGGPILLWTWMSYYHLTDLLSSTFHEVFWSWIWSLHCPHKQPRGFTPSFLPLPPGSS